MLNIKKLNSFFSTQKNYILYIFIFFIICAAYLGLPKILNFSEESIKINLKSNNNININNISKINYKIFPTPRLKILNSDFVIGEGEVEINDSELEIILNISQILNFKEINYKELLIKNGSSKINLDNINQLLINSNKNKKKLTLKKHDLIFYRKKNIFFEIKDALINASKSENFSFFKINGNFLGNKVILKLDNKLKNKNNLVLKVPGLDISTNVFFEKNNSGIVNGIFNLEIFDNFLKFNFIKDENIKLTNSFIRSKLINSSLKGTVAFNPNFFLNLDFDISNINAEKLFVFMKKIYFSDNINNLSLVKKLNGIFNFKSKFEGTIINENGKIFLKDFKVGKNKSLFFNAKIIEFGKKGKIQFNLIKTGKNKRDLKKRIEIIGFLIPTSSKIVFDKFLINGTKLSTEKTKEYENDFKETIIQNSLTNIFNENKINKYFKNLF